MTDPTITTLWTLCPGCNRPSLSLCFTYEPGIVQVHCLNPLCYLEWFEKHENIVTP